MGKGKRSSGKNYTSKGERSNVAKSTRRAMRQEYMASGRRILNQIAALEKGQDVVMTIENPNREETDKPFIKVRVNAKEWLAGKNGKGRSYIMGSTAGVES